MEQLSYLARFRVDAGEIRALVKIAVDASQTEILLVVGAPVLARADVFDVKRSQRGIFLVQSAIFTTVGSPDCARGRGSLRSRNCTCMHRPGFATQDGDKFVSLHITHVFLALFECQFTLGGLGGEDFDALAQNFIGCDGQDGLFLAGKQKLKQWTHAALEGRPVAHWDILRLRFQPSKNRIRPIKRRTFSCSKEPFKGARYAANHSAYSPVP